MKKTIDLLLDINSKTFDYLVVIFLIMILIESIIGKIKYFININLFLGIIIVLGIINIIHKLKK